MTHQGDKRSQSDFCICPESLVFKRRRNHWASVHLLFPVKPSTLAFQKLPDIRVVPNRKWQMGTHVWHDVFKLCTNCPAHRVNVLPNKLSQHLQVYLSPHFCAGSDVLSRKSPTCQFCKNVTMNVFSLNVSSLGDFCHLSAHYLHATFSLCIPFDLKIVCFKKNDIKWFILKQLNLPIKWQLAEECAIWMIDTAWTVKKTSALL